MNDAVRPRLPLNPPVSRPVRWIVASLAFAGLAGCSDEPERGGASANLRGGRTPCAQPASRCAPAKAPRSTSAYKPKPDTAPHPRSGTSFAADAEREAALSRPVAPGETLKPFGPTPPPGLVQWLNDAPPDDAMTTVSPFSSAPH